MSVERLILIAAWVLIFLIWTLFIPKKRRREAIIIFLANQVFSWSVSLFLVENQWVENPTREFSQAAESNFTFNYALYPTVNVIHSLYYPRKQKVLVKILYSFFYPSLIAVFTLIVANYTDLIQYVRLKWYGGFLFIPPIFYLVHKYYEWYFSAFPRSNEAKTS